MQSRQRERERETLSLRSLVRNDRTISREQIRALFHASLTWFVRFLEPNYFLQADELLYRRGMIIGRTSARRPRDSSSRNAAQHRRTSETRRLSLSIGTRLFLYTTTRVSAISFSPLVKYKFILGVTARASRALSPPSFQVSDGTDTLARRGKSSRLIFDYSDMSRETFSQKFSKRIYCDR